MPKTGGIILAGGKSSRMGSDKAFKKIEGIEMLGRVIENLDPLVDDLIISTNHDSHRVFKRALIYDDLPEMGPLSGINSALINTVYEYNIVLSCDTPYVHGAILQTLLNASLNAKSIITVASCKGKLQPLCGVYRKSAQPQIENLLINGVRKMHKVLSHLQAKTVEFPESEFNYFLNINKEDDIPVNTKDYES